MSAWDVQAGIQKKFLAPGETAFWGGYGQVNDGWAPGSNGNGGNLGGVPADSILKAGTFANVSVPTEIVGSEVDRWFLALDQGFESAAMHLYLAYQHFNADMSLVTRDPSVSPNGKLKNVASVDRRLRPDLFGRPHLLLTDLLSSEVKTALRGGLFLRVRALGSARVGRRAVATVPQTFVERREFSCLSRPLTAFATGLKSRLHALILYAESRPCGIVRLRLA